MKYDADWTSAGARWSDYLISAVVIVLAAPLVVLGFIWHLGSDPSDD